jgi:hypothetical protein
MAEVCSICGTALNQFNAAASIGGAPACAACRREFDADRSPPVVAVTAVHAVAIPPAPVTSQVSVPTYGAVRVVCGFLRVMGFSSIIAAVLGGVILMVGMLDPQGTVPVLRGTEVMIGGVINAILLFGLEQLLACVRDMAINSFFIRNHAAAA